MLKMNSGSRTLIESTISTIVLGSLASLASYLPEEIRAMFFIGSAIVVFSALFLPRAVRFIKIFLDEKYRHEKELLIAQKSIGKDKLLQSIYDKQHFLIHIGRDLAVKNMPVVPKYSDVIALQLKGASSTAKASSLEILTEAEIERTVRHMLQHLVEIFQEATDKNAKIWACIRDRRSDDSYHSWLRAGTFNPNRVYSSRPMDKNSSSTIRSLKTHFDLEKRCVMLTGQGSSTWEGQKNDKFREDLSVLMGAVMTRSWDGSGWTNNCLSWIVFVNADREGVFTDAHTPTMQACIDIFSWLANSLLRIQCQRSQSSTP